jgi:hypothetical protein
MSSTRDDENGRSGFHRIIREAKEEAFHARRMLRREQPDVGMQTKRDVAAALSDYRDVLWDYHEEDALDTEWDEREVDVDVIDRLLSETVTVEQSLNRRGGAVQRSEVPLVANASVEFLLDIGKELDAIAKELGFAASAREKTPHTDTSEKDLVGLLKARGQEQAIENLPKRFRSDS